MWNWSTAVAEHGAAATCRCGLPSGSAPTVRDPEAVAAERVTTGGERVEGNPPWSDPGAPATPERDRYDLAA